MSQRENELNQTALMRRGMRLVAVLALAAIACAGQSREPTDGEPIRVFVELRDGSRIAGTAMPFSLKLQTDFGVVSIPCERIHEMERQTTQPNAIIRLRNGDHLTGHPVLAAFPLQSLLGSATIPLADIKAIRVQHAGTGVPARHAGDLLLYYSFDTDQGDAVADQSGRGNHGRVHGARWTERGKVGGAFAFDGHDYIALPQKRFLDGRTDVTICAWINLETGYRGGQIIASGDARLGHDPLSTRINASGFEDFGLCDAAGGRKLETTGRITGIGPGTWHMIAITLEAQSTRSTYRVYLDGLPINHQDAAQTLTIAYDRDMPTQIGAIHGTQGWGGMIDEVMVYQCALSEDEIRKMYLDSK